MGASFQKDDRDWLKSIFHQGNFSGLEAAVISSAFDQQTDIDVEVIKVQLQKEKYLRRICLSKICSYPFEIVVIFLLLGRQKAKEHRQLIKLYVQFYKKRISFSSFQTKLKTLIKEEKL